MSSAVRLPLSQPIHDARSRPLSETLLAKREWFRLFAVVGAITVDASLLAGAAVLAAQLRFGNITGGSSYVLLLLMFPAFLFASTTSGSYLLEVLSNPLRSAAKTIMAFITSAAFAFTAAFALGVSDHFSRLETGYFLVIGALGLVLGRFCGARIMTNLRYVGEPCTYILGDETSTNYGRLAQRVVNVRNLNWIPSADDPDFLDAIYRTFRNADRVVLVFADSEERSSWATFMRLTGINTELMKPDLTQIAPLGIGRWANTPTLVISRGPLSLPERVVKRAVDLAGGLTLALVAAPLVGLLALLIKFESPGPCFFVQHRVGRKNAKYRCFKLRTMRVDATDEHGRQSASRDDDRVTPLGRFLRRTSLDELPQLWNVFVGNMSLVGPRPHALASTAEGELFWHAVNGYWTRHAMKPGLTGLAQVRGFRGATRTKGDIERRVAADLEYVNSWSIWLDLKILARTPLVLIHRNAF